MRDREKEFHNDQLKPPAAYKRTKETISKSRNTRLGKDITLDLIELLMIKRLNINHGFTSGKKGSTKSSLLKNASVILGIISSLVFIGIIFFKQSGNKQSNPFKVYEDCTIFSNIPIYGKQKKINSIIKKLVKMINIIDKYSDSPYLHMKLQPSSRNFLFYGAPGTGKTLIVKKLAFNLDMEMRLRKRLVIDNDSNFKGKYNYEMLYKMQPTLKLIIVQPSSLIDKFVGATEKNIRQLFDKAQELAKYYIVIIFIDEIEAFFSKRNEKTSEHALNAKTEFLCILDGVKTELTDKIFFIGATNVKDQIDQAFLRRLDNQIFFDKPDDFERMEMIAKITEGYFWSEQNSIREISSKLRDKSQSEIRAIFSRIENSKNEKWPIFTLEEILQGIEGYRIENETTDDEVDTLLLNKINKTSCFD